MITEGAIIDGRYRILRPLGGGAMGKVYLAEKVTTHERFAIKFIHDYLVSDDTYHARFEREVNSLRGIRHPHVVALYDWRIPERGKAGAAYIVMEYLTGESMQQALVRQGGMSLEEVIRIMMQVLDGMTQVHALGIIHRDMSPANVFLVGIPGSYRSAKILDFGLAKGEAAASSSDADGGVTQDGAVLGRAAYAAPEMFLARDLDARADVFACGMIMYRALAGRFPYRESKTELMWVERYATRNEEMKPYTSARTFNPAIPAPVDQIISLAVQKRPAARYQSAEEMHRDLLKVEEMLRLTPKLAPQATDVTSPAAAPPADSTTVTTPAPAGARPDGSPTPPPPLTSVSEWAAGHQLEQAAAAQVAEQSRSRIKRWAVRNPKTGRLAAIAVLAVGLLAVTLAILLRDGTAGTGPAAAVSLTTETDAGGASTVGAPLPSQSDAGASTTPPDSRDEGATDAPVGAGEVGPGSPARVAITLAGLPEGAEATVDGVKAVDGVVQVPLGDQPVPVKASAPGFEPYESTLLPLEDTIFFVEMQAATPADAGTGEARGPADAGAEATVPVRDAGAVRRDAGTVRRDAGTVRRDAGTVRRDAGAGGIIPTYE